MLGSILVGSRRLTLLKKQKNIQKTYPKDIPKFTSSTQSKQSKKQKSLNKRKLNIRKNKRYLLFLIIQKNMHNKTSYLNHTLNNSPSKTTYTFSRSVRFSTFTNQYGEVQSFSNPNRQLSPYRTNGSFQRQKKYKKSKSIEKRDKNQRNNRSRDTKSKQKRSPKKIQYSPNSPNRKRQSSPENIGNQKISPSKKGEVLKSYRNGYYPYGIEINKDGRYYVSNYQNVQSHSFGRTSSRDMSYINNADDKLGPGHYDTIHKSPGKYMTSDNKNNDGHKFSRSPRKFTQQKTINTNPGPYNYFSQFGPVK